MKESYQIVAALKKILKLKGFTYYDVAKGIKISEASVKRIFSTNTFSLQRLETICNFINIKISDLCKINEIDQIEDKNEYTRAQEDFFCAHPKCMAFFELLLKDNSVLKIKQQYRLTDADIDYYLVSLENLGLITTSSNRKVRFTFKNVPVWKRDGKLAKKYIQIAKNEFLKNAFESNDLYSTFLNLELSTQSINRIKNQLADISKEIMTLSNLERITKCKQDSIGLMMCFRPWKYSLFEEI